MWDIIESEINKHSTTPFSIGRKQVVTGGCINNAYLLIDHHCQYFVKTNNINQQHMFAAEAKGLEEIIQTNTIKAPRPVCTGIAEQSAYLVMESLVLSTQAGNAELLAENLAAMHESHGQQFGWSMDNTIGSTPQINSWTEDWVDFFQNHRLHYQLKLAEQNGGPRKLLDRGDRLLADMAIFFDNHKPQPSLLHGDLWSGNYAYTDDGEPVIFDPAVYYGDREADLAMTELFGGFSADFYAAYSNHYALGNDYAVRKILYNLYHILNHFNLFGGGYGSQAEDMVNRLLSEIH